MASQATTVGEEDINAEALESIQNAVIEGDQILFQSGFDFESKVIALTNIAIYVGDELEGVVGVFPYEESQAIRRDRTLVVSYTGGSGQREQIRYKMGDEGVVRVLVERINQLRRQWESELAGANADGSDEPAHENDPNPHLAPDADMTREAPTIDVKVKFWEEQDKINQALIPRFIDQSKLLTKHIKEHDNLPQVAGNAISQALSACPGRTETTVRSRPWTPPETELAGQTRTSIRQATEHLQADLSAHKSELSEHTQAAVQKALDDMRTALADAKVELSEHTQASLTQATEQLQSGLTTHTATLSEQAQSGLDQALMTLREESRKARNLLIGIASGACAIAIAAIIVAVLT